MVEYILGLPGEPDLIDQLGRHQLVNDRFDPQAVSRSRPNREPMTAAAPSVRFAFGSSRSMRAAMVACNVAGTFTSATSAVEMYAPRSPRSTPRSASSRTISSAKNGLPAARSAIVWPNRDEPRSRPRAAP